MIVVSPDGKPLAANGCATSCSGSSSAINSTAATAAGSTSRSRARARIADGRIDVAAGKPGRISLPVTWGRYRLEVASDDRSIPPTSVMFDAGFYSDASADTPDLLEIALDKPEYAAGRHHDSRRHGPHRRQGRRSTWSATSWSTTTTRRAGRHGTIPLTVGRDWGTGAYVVATLRRPLDEAASRMPGRAIGLQWFSVDRRRAHARGRDAAADPDAAERAAARAGQARRALTPAKRRGRRRGGRCRHSQSHQLQAAGARRLLSRPAPALGRDARPLRPVARRHAGHARRDPHRRRRRRHALQARRRRSRRSRSIPASSR